MVLPAFDHRTGHFEDVLIHYIGVCAQTEGASDCGISSPCSPSDARTNRSPTTSVSEDVCRRLQQTIFLPDLHSRLVPHLWLTLLLIIDPAVPLIYQMKHNLAP
jgi:hypothetical protein